jgi:hypothetical protein
MKIEEGKYYKTRDGRKVGPMVNNGNDNEPFVWTDGNGGCWAHNGEDGLAFGRIGTPTPGDCVAELIDVYTIPTMPFGLLTPEQQQALRDHDGVTEFYTGKGWEVASTPAWLVRYTYRAKPKPALVPDTVPWDAIAPEYVQYVRTASGACYICPRAMGWRVRVDGFLVGHSIGSMPAADATQYRPGYKP